MSRKRKTRICREGWYFLLILAFVVTGATLRDINLLLLLAGAMFGLLIFNYRAVSNTLTGLTVHRKLPHAVCAGDLLIVEIAVENTRPRRASHAVRVSDPITRSGEQAEADVLFPEIKPGTIQKRSYQGRLSQRGVYQFGPCRLSTRFPLGLIRQTVTTDESQTLTVFPRIGRLTPAWNRIYQESMLGSRRTRRRQSATDGDFLALRDWQPGDNRRWIHWKTSARRGRFVVRQFEQQQSQDLLLLLDLWQPDQPTEEQLDNVELAASFAATVASDLCRRGGSQLDVGVAGAEATFSHGEASGALLNEVMENLAKVVASPTVPLAELLETSLSKSSAGTTTLLISTRETDLRESSLVESLEAETCENLTSRRIFNINSASEELSVYFRPD